MSGLPAPPPPAAAGRRFSWLSAPRAIGAVGLANLLAYLPGELSADAADQLAEARSGGVSDWHSPWLTVVWRQLLHVHDHPAGMLVLQLAMFWGGAMLLAHTLAAQGRQRAAWGVLGLCLFPPFWFYNHYILKDTAFYSAMFLCAATWFAALNAAPARRRLWVGAAVAMTLLALPIRINGAFAMAGLLVGLWVFTQARRTWVLLPALLVVSAALVLGVRAFNTGVLRAGPSDVMQSLQIHDLMGVQHFSRDTGVWGPYALGMDEVDRCYTPYFWDTLSPTGLCAGLRQHLGAPDGRFFTPEAIAQRGRLWRQAVQDHPWAYLQHRLHYFNSATYFIVPALHARFSKQVRDGRRPDLMPYTARDVRLDWVKRNPLVWPITWLAAGAGVLILLWPRATQTLNARFAAAVAGSGLAYGLAYVVIGVATDVRYFLWTILATGLAAVVSHRELRDAANQRPATAFVVLAAVATALMAGIAARWMEVPFIG